MSEFQYKPATREGVKPLIGLYAESGAGKTYSALLLARGIAGPKGRIGMIDTESGRGSLYADVLPGGYDVMQLGEPFGPSRYVEAITASENAGIDVLVIDSMSHSWEGIGGVLDMAGENEANSGKAGLHNWKKPKLEHNKLMLKLLQTRLIIICCIRAKYKSRQIKNDRGKTEIVKDDFPSPIQADDFIFEMTAHALIHPNHTITLTKCSHPALGECFPQDGKEPLNIHHGELIAKWASSGTTSSPQKPKPDDRSRAKAALWNAAKVKFVDTGGQPDLAAFEKYLRAGGHMGENETLSDLSSEQLTALLPVVQDAEFNF